MNVEKTFQTISTVLTVVFVTALVAIGGNWAYENWDWLSHPRHPLAWMIPDPKAKGADDLTSFMNGTPLVPTNFDFKKMNEDWKDWKRNMDSLHSQPSYPPQFRRR